LAYRWLLDQGYAPSRLFLGGESSGGGLALQALLSMKNDKIPMPRAAFFISPVGDAGVDVDFKVWPGLWHVFQAVARFVPEAQDSIEELGRYVRKCLPEGLAAGENLRAPDS
jgi:acetyl esterase/lipase